MAGGFVVQKKPLWPLSAHLFSFFSSQITQTTFLRS